MAKTNAEYRKWIRAQWPCCVPITEATKDWYPTKSGRIEAAHVQSRGAGGKDDGNLVPLCATHHEEQHRMGIKSFEKKYNLDLKATALRYWGAFCRSAVVEGYSQEEEGS